MTATAAVDQRDAACIPQLAFHLGQEACGVRLQDVKEIRGWTPVVPIPGSPSHVPGVLNLRWKPLNSLPPP